MYVSHQSIRVQFLVLFFSESDCIYFDFLPLVALFTCNKYFLMFPRKTYLCYATKFVIYTDFLLRKSLIVAVQLFSWNMFVSIQTFFPRIYCTFLGFDQIRVFILVKFTMSFQTLTFYQIFLLFHRAY